MDRKVPSMGGLLAEFRFSASRMLTVEDRAETMVADVSRTLKQSLLTDRFSSAWKELNKILIILLAWL